MEGQLSPQEVVAESGQEGGNGGAHGQPHAGEDHRPGQVKVDLYYVRHLWQEARRHGPGLHWPAGPRIL
eukprot:2979269-Heterocapsa_arctica.AAC.1